METETTYQLQAFLFLTTALDYGEYVFSVSLSLPAVAEGNPFHRIVNSDAST